jgi:hypothetical protein
VFSKAADIRLIIAPFDAEILRKKQARKKLADYALGCFSCQQPQITPKCLLHHAIYMIQQNIKNL